MKMIPIMKPSLGGNELKYVTNCVETEWISSQGTFVTKFEELVGEYIGLKNAVAVSNGTVALHLALISLGIGEGDEVIVPDMTFAASVNAVIHANATPVLVDVDRNTFNINVSEIEKAITDKTKAIMPVHLYGNPCDMDQINEIAQKHNLLVIEDAAESLGSIYKGKQTGSIADAAIFSFYGNKTITTGEGGIVVFKDDNAYERACVLRDHGMQKDKRYWHNYIGYNYRMTNLQAAIGVAQMERIDEIINRKIEIANIYIEGLNKIDGITIPELDFENSRNTYWLFTFLIDLDIDRSELIEYLKDHGIETRPVFYCIHNMPPYMNYRHKDLSNSKYISKNGVSIPSFIELTDDQLRYIVETIQNFFFSKKNG
ncbi:MAG: DegT/DnrJ/EryC1/StrS family aminotransferase [Balneolaceae bacterium]